MPNAINQLGFSFLSILVTNYLMLTRMNRFIALTTNTDFIHLDLCIAYRGKGIMRYRAQDEPKCYNLKANNTNYKQK